MCTYVAVNLCLMNGNFLYTNQLANVQRIFQELQQKSCKTVIPSPQSHLENKSALAKMSSIKKCSWFSDGAQTRLQQYTPQKVNEMPCIL